MTTPDPTSDPQATPPAENPALQQPEAPSPAETPAPARRLHPALWVLIVLGAFIAGGALWFAIFGSPQVIGTDTGQVPGSTTASGLATATPTGVTTSTAPITADDVKAVLSAVDYVEPDDSQEVEYNNAITHVLAGVDVLTFAQNTLETTSAIWWREPGSSGVVVLKGPEKSAIVAESTAAYLKRVSSLGDATALGDMMGIWLQPPDAFDRNRADSQLEVIAQGLRPLGLMFGAQDKDNSWVWTVEDVTVTGPNTADVTYSAQTLPGTNWRFIDPSLRYTKHLQFSRVAGRWLLSGWSNYAQVKSKFDSNVVPAGSAPFDEWFAAL